MESIVYSYAHTLLTFAHAEGAAELYLLAESVLQNEMLKLLNYLTGAFDMAGASDTNCNFYHEFIPLFVYNVFCRYWHLFLKKSAKPDAEQRSVLCSITDNLRRLPNG